MQNVKGKRTGFTIVELGIVLLIIGALLAAIMSGRDVVRGAQTKRFQQQFAMKWLSVAGSYYDKTGSFLGDGFVNGGTGTATTNTPNGEMDGSIFDGTTDNDPVAILNSVGIDVCNLVKSTIANQAGAGGQTTSLDECNGRAASQATVTGEYAGAQTVSVDFVGMTVTQGTDGGEVTRNFMVLHNVPTDVAIALDTATDGVANGTQGFVMCLTEITSGTGTALTGADQTAVAWPDASDGTTVTMVVAMDF